MTTTLLDTPAQHTRIPYSPALSRPQERKPYQPFGACRALWRTSRRQVCLDGPANTGKSRGVLEKVHYCLDKYPKTRGLMVRKTRHSLTHSGMITYEQKVLPDGWLIKRKRQAGRIYWNASDQQYEYPNGSIFAVSGLDDPQKIQSSEWDIIFFQQAEQGTLNDWEMLDLRMRNHRMPYQQLIGDVNPSFSHHWMKQLFEQGRVLHLPSRHSDNPAITPEDIAALEALTGLRRLRYYLGIWASAEGVVYDEWDAARHILSRAQLIERNVLYADGTLNRKTIRHLYGGADWGYTNPGVLHVYGADYDGRLYLLREVYRTERTINWWITQGHALTREFHHPAGGIEHWLGDPSRPDYIAQFNEAGLPMSGAINSIALGVGFLKQRLKGAGDGSPRFFVYENATPERDELLEEDEQHLHRPSDFTGEIEQYVWAEAKDGKPLKEEPVDDCNHALDVARYVCAHLDAGSDVDTLGSEIVEAISSFRGY